MSEVHTHASAAVSILRRHGLLLYWLAFAIHTLDAARHPGWVPKGTIVPYPWVGVLVTWAVLGMATAGLHAILRPRTFRRSWGRVVAALAYALALTVLALVTFVTDMPGYTYVPVRYALVTLIGVVLLAFAVALAPLRDTASESPTSIS